MLKLIKDNLKLMKSNEQGGMQYCLERESMAGNAGKHNEMPCMVANFCYDDTSGELKYFGNYQDVPPDIYETSVSGYLRIAFDIKKDSVNDIILNDKTNPKTRKAKFILEKTIEMYNNKKT